MTTSSTPMRHETPAQPTSAPRETAHIQNTIKGANTSAALALAPQTETMPNQDIQSLEDIIALLEHANEVLLAGRVYQFVHLVKLKEQQLEINAEPEAPQKLSQDLRQALVKITGQNWMVSVSRAQGEPTLAQQAQARFDAQRNDILNTPIMKSVIENFPGAELIDISTIKKK